MKNLLNFLVIALVATFAFTSCNKGNDFDWNEYNKQQEELYKKQKQQRDSTLNAQKPILAAYAQANFTNPVFDDSTGIWFEILEPATNDDYEYTINQSGNWVTPIASVKYEGKLINGTVFDNTTVAKEMNIVEARMGQPGLIPAWPIAFRPKTVVFQNKEYRTGLIDKGLQKGNKIRFIAPSPYCYGPAGTTNIPADSPLIFTIEVVSIK